MTESDRDSDDAEFAKSLLEPLQDDAPLQSESLVARVFRRARLDILFRDVLDLAALRFLHARRDGDADDRAE